MPDVNRIRICNIKYNDGNNYYDDFLIKLGGKNAYMDLINGVGKTFYMQCINQPILPNSKFDKKKSINLLFNKHNKNKVFHSIIEFRLDHGSAYKYAMVGVCAYAKENKNKFFGEEHNESNEKFNMLKYICLYNKANQFDIENFPISKVDEKGNKKFISKNTLERILKEIQNEDTMDYAVIINDTNRRHYEELSKLNINESEFLEMIELNKYEGNSANYLKPFQTGKDFILDALIPIIEKSYRIRNSDDYETSKARANTLITLRKTLETLQKKESLRNVYEYIQTELVNSVPKIKNLLNFYNEKDKIIFTLSKYKKIISYNKGLNEENIINISASITNTEKLLSDKKVKIDELNKEKDAYEIKEAKLKFESLEKEQLLALNACKSKENNIKRLEDNKLRYECEKDYRIYLNLKEKVKVKEESIRALTKGKELILADYNYWGCYYKKALIEAIDKKDKSYLAEKDKLDKLNQNKFNLGTSISSVETEIKNLEGLYKSSLKKIDSLDKVINDIKKGIYHLIKEDIIKELEVNKELSYKKQEELRGLKVDLENNKVTVTSYKNEIKMQEQDIINKRSRLSELIKEIDKYNNELFNYNLIRQKYTYQEQTISKYLNGVINTINEKTRKINVEMTLLNTNIRDLDNETSVSLSDLARQQFDIVSSNYPSAILGSRFLDNKTLEERQVLFNITELIPYGIIVDKYDFNKIINDISLRRKFNDEVVPIINSEALHGIGMVGMENVTFTVRDKECFIDPEFNEKQLIKLRKKVDALNLEQLRLNNDLNSIKNDYNTCIKFENKYNQEEVKEKEQLIKKLEEEINSISDVIDKSKGVIESTEKKIADIQEKSVELKECISSISDAIKELEKEFEDYETLEKLSKERTEMNSKVSTNESTLERFKKQLLEKKFEAEEINKKIPEVLSGVNGLYREFIEMKKELSDLKFIATNEVTDFQEDIPLSEIKSNFYLYKKNAEGKINDLESAQEYIDDIEKSINSIVKEIERKNENNSGDKYNIEYFVNIDLFNGDYNNYLTELDKSIKDSKKELSKLNTFERELKTKVDELKGYINNMCNKFKHKYNGFTYEEMNLSDENIKEELDKIDICLNSTESEITRLKEAIQEFNKSKNVLEKEFKTLMEYESVINRVLDRNSLQLYEVEVEDYTQSLSEVKAIEADVSTVLSSLRNSRFSYESALDMIISNLVDSELVHFKEDLETLRQSTPESKEECRLIIDRLQGEHGYIKSLDEEKDRISSIINELKEDEEIFINQLLQKCEQVYNELSNLTYISKININGKSTSMIEVIVKPADDVIRKARMKTYINHLVKGLEDIEESKRISYLSNNLTLKDLFSQFVDNINNCDVKIYKVDAIESNSKSIPWAEVIGSTGQSNGMAYNIFICLISFIKKLYNPYVGDESRKFVMFDAPFSGMAASYIWEPIIKLLDENNFQVLCLGYDMPSNLLPLFDIKYYLGTDVNNSGTQTVVVKKLKSEVDLNKLSYKKLVGEQIAMLE